MTGVSDDAFLLHAFHDRSRPVITVLQTTLDVPWKRERPQRFIAAPREMDHLLVQRGCVA